MPKYVHWVNYPGMVHRSLVLLASVQKYKMFIFYKSVFSSNSTHYTMIDAECSSGTCVLDGPASL